MNDFDYDCKECSYGHWLFYPDGSLDRILCDLDLDDIDDPDITTPCYINRF